MPDPLSNRRCPLDSLEHNLFSPTHAAERKSEIDPKLLASSSKAQQHDEDALDKISNEIGDISLDGSTGRKSGRRSRPANSGIRSPNTDRNELADPQGDECSGIAECMQNLTEALVEGLNSLSIASNKASAVHTHDDNHSGRDSSISVPRVDSAIKLKTADISLNPPEGFLRAKSKGDQLDGRSDVKEYLQNKPQQIFQDILQGDEPHSLHERSWGVNTSMHAPRSSFLNSLDASPNFMQEDHHPGLVSYGDIVIPGIGMITEGQGVPSCSDGIFNRNDLKKDGLMSLMDIDESRINQIEE